MIREEPRATRRIEHRRARPRLRTCTKALELAPWAFLMAVNVVLLIVGSGLALHVALSQQPGIKRTDLLRNDLGKVSVSGTVHTTSLFDIERFETVWQMTSTVEATLKARTSLVDLMTALFPCGSRPRR